MQLYGGKKHKKNKQASAPAESKTPKEPRAPKQPKAPKERKIPAGLTKAKLVIIVAAVVLAVLLAAACAGVVYVNGIDTIYPNVTLDGHEIGGMSVTELAAELGALGYSSQDGKLVKVELPQDFVLEVRGTDVCSETPVADIAQMAYDACKGGSAFEDAITYLKCKAGGMELASETVLTVDEAAVRAAVDNMARQVEQAMLGSDLTIGEESVVIIKGAASVEIDAEELTAMIVNAFQTENYDTLVYEPEIQMDTELDVDGLYNTVYCEAADAYYDKEAGEIVPAVVGMDFEVDEARKLWDEAELGDAVEIPLILTQPEVSTEELEELLFRDLLSSKSTSLKDSSANRISNVALASEAINELVLMPGEEFSYNDVVGKRTAERGYLPAGAYSNGQTVQEYGGGICQVSSTIYYCALYSNLEITDRLCHMFGVSYLPPGLDATVSWGGPEFKFVNDREYPIMLKAWVEDKDLYVEIWGTDTDGSYVEMTYATWYVFDQEYTDVKIGYKAQTYRSVFDKDGNLLSKEKEALSSYNFHAEDIEWPEETGEPGTTPSPDVSATPTPSSSSDLTTPQPSATVPPVVSSSSDIGGTDSPEPTEPVQ